MFEIRKYYNVHTCSLDSHEKDHRQALSKVVGQNFRHKFDGASSSSSYKARFSKEVWLLNKLSQGMESKGVCNGDG